MVALLLATSLLVLPVGTFSLARGEKKSSLVHLKVLSEEQAETWGARALDGSPYAYYASPSNASGPLDWIIYLEGGGECETYHDCVQRINDQGSSKKLKATLDADKDVSDGMTIKDPAINPDFYAFGTLFLPYLSGDDWAGQERRACVPWGDDQNCSGKGATKKRPLFFCGHNNFEAAIADWYASLVVKPRSVLLSGGSAGGQGAFFHADRLAEILPAGTVVKANPQYGWFGAPTDTFPDWRKGAHTDPAKPYPSSGSPIAVPPWMFNISLFVPKNCLATLGPQDSPYLCTAYPRVALTVAVPLFVSTNLFDAWLTSVMEQVPDGKLGPTKKADPKLAYMLGVTALSTRATVRRAVPSNASASRAAFVPECFNHPMEWTHGSQAYRAPVLGARNCTHGAAVASWFFERGDCERVLIGEEDRPTALSRMPCNNGLFNGSSFFTGVGHRLSAKQYAPHLGMAWIASLGRGIEQAFSQ